MQDPFSHEDFYDDFKNKQINAIFFSNEAYNDSIKNGTDFLGDDEYLYKQDVSNGSNTTSSEITKEKRRRSSHLKRRK